MDAFFLYAKSDTVQLICHKVLWFKFICGNENIHLTQSYGALTVGVHENRGPEEEFRFADSSKNKERFTKVQPFCMAACGMVDYH